MNPALAPAPGTVGCPVCGHQLVAQRPAPVGTPAPCLRCGARLTVWTFPVLAQRREDRIDAGQIALDGEATCFFHPLKRADRPCDRCGRFLCALCALPFGARHLCPTCIAAGTEKTPVLELTTRGRSWPQLALTLGAIPLVPLLWFVWPLYVITGPMAILVAVYGWNKPGSIVHGPRKVSAMLAVLGGAVQIGVVLFVVYYSWRGNVRA